MSIQGYWFPRGIKLQKINIPQFLQQNTPKMGVNRHFQAKLANWDWHIIETTEPIQTKFCTVTETTKIHFVGGPNRRITNPRWRTAAILQNRKRPYLSNALTDLHKIWHDDPSWLSEGYGQLKFPTFENPRWRTAAILKIENGLISATPWPICTKFGRVMHFGPQKGMGS